jgi:hypothetical protein
MSVPFESLLNAWPLSLLTTTAIAIGLLMLSVAAKLVFPIIVPRILTYPWPMPDGLGRRRRDKKLTVVLAGSYNPPHNGHMAMLRYLSERYERWKGFYVLPVMLTVCSFRPILSYPFTPISQVWSSDCCCWI